jgi:hypothetical protein
VAQVARVAAVALTVAIAACGCKTSELKRDESMKANESELKRHLAAAREQSISYFSGATLPEAGAVRAAAQGQSAPWEALTPEERFYLFEIDPTIAARAPGDVRAAAACAGVADAPPEWWGRPYAMTGDAARTLVSLGRATTGCLRPLLDDTTPLRYRDGESNASAEHFSWTTADLAAALIAEILAAPWDGRAPAADRAARRADLRALAL